MKKFYIFYQTFIFTNVGEVALKVVQGVPDGHSLLAFNASPGQELNAVNLYRENKHIGSIPTSWEEFNKAWNNAGGKRK